MNPEMPPDTQSTSPIGVESECKGIGERRKVEFDHSVRVILIPTRGEYKQVGLYGSLWWDSFEFSQFQASVGITLLSACLTMVPSFDYVLHLITFALLPASLLACLLNKKYNILYRKHAHQLTLP